MEDGIFTSKFDDSMYFQNDVDESVVSDIPPLTDYIEGEFDEESIFAMYLLMRSSSLLPMSNYYYENSRRLLLRIVDFINLPDETIGAYAKDERIQPNVILIDTCRAFLSCAFWSKSEGLCVEQIAVIRSGNGYFFGSPHIVKIADSIYE